MSSKERSDKPFRHDLQHLILISFDFDSIQIDGRRERGMGHRDGVAKGCEDFEATVKRAAACKGGAKRWCVLGEQCGLDAT